MMDLLSPFACGTSNLHPLGQQFYVQIADVAGDHVLMCIHYYIPYKQRASLPYGTFHGPTRVVWF